MYPHVRRRKPLTRVHRIGHSHIAGSRSHLRDDRPRRPAIAALFVSPVDDSDDGLGASGPSLKPSTSETSAGWHAHNVSRKLTEGCTCADRRDRSPKQGRHAPRSVRHRRARRGRAHPRLRVDLLRVVQERERTHASCSRRALVVEQHGRNDQRAGQRPAPRLVRARPRGARRAPRSNRRSFWPVWRRFFGGTNRG